MESKKKPDQNYVFFRQGHLKNFGTRVPEANCIMGAQICIKRLNEKKLRVIFIEKSHSTLIFNDN